MAPPDCSWINLAIKLNRVKSKNNRVASNLGVYAAFVKSVYALCKERGKTEPQAIGFILRGFGCPEAEERMMEALGYPP